MQSSNLPKFLGNKQITSCVRIFLAALERRIWLSPQGEKVSAKLFLVREQNFAFTLNLRCFLVSLVAVISSNTIFTNVASVTDFYFILFFIYSKYERWDMFPEAYELVGEKDG